MKNNHEIKIIETPVILKQCIDTWKSISLLNGFLISSNKIYLLCRKSLKLAQVKSDIELDGYSISYQRLFEFQNSNFKLNDNVLNSVFLNQNKELTNKELNHLSICPLFNQNYNELELLKKEFNPTLEIKTIHVANMNKIKQWNSSIYNEYDCDSMLYASSLFAQLLVIQPYSKLNHFAGIKFLNQWLVQLGHCQADILPIGYFFQKNNKQLMDLLKEVKHHGFSQELTLQVLKIIEKSAEVLLNQLIELNQLYEFYWELLSKYNLYKMNHVGLLNAIIEQPYLRIKDIIRHTNCHRHSASAYLFHLEKMGVIILQKDSKEKVYFNKKLFDCYIQF